MNEARTTLAEFITTLDELNTADMEAQRLHVQAIMHTLKECRNALLIAVNAYAEMN